MVLPPITTVRSVVGRAVTNDRYAGPFCNKTNSQFTNQHSHKEVIMSKKAISLVVAVLLLATLLTPSPAMAAAETFTYRDKFDIYFLEYVPCAAGGEGEWVELSGKVNNVYHITYDARSGFHLTNHWNYQGVRGVGWTTGDKYRATGSGQYKINGKIGYVETSVWHFKVNGQGPGNNFSIRANFHITVNANGTVTAYHDNWTVQCK